MPPSTTSFIHSTCHYSCSQAASFLNPTHTDGSAYKALIIKKIKRLLVPYFTCSVIVITLKLLSQGNAYVENPVTAFSYLKMFYLPEAGYFLWFIWALFTMFLITPLFKTRTARNWMFLASIILAYAPFTLPEAFCLNQFKRMYVYCHICFTAYMQTYKSRKAQLVNVNRRSFLHNLLVPHHIRGISKSDFDENTVRRRVMVYLLGQSLFGSHVGDCNSHGHARCGKTICRNPLPFRIEIATI